uniref:Phosphoesterase PA-phosphatase related protein n=1 Tax=Geobacter sp. (strain M21) TaxID=443144 RepID=C6E8G6_GEOSM
MEKGPEAKGLWRWRRTGAAEYAGIALFGVGAALVESEYGRPEAKWKGHNGFDDSIRDILRLTSREDRETAQNIGDLLMWGMIAAPVVDSFATLGVRDGDWGAQWQTQMVNLESYAFTSLVSAALQTFVAREKPFVRNCQNGVCEGDNINRSMPSGHAAFAFTGAGLVCNHHKYQSLYHDPAADRAACATGLVLATADGVARIMADHHYATDVVAGSAIGLFSGFILPRLLHYSHPELSSRQQNSPFPFLRQLSLRPLLGPGSTGLSCELRF